jgi:hypothetical protein
MVNWRLEQHTLTPAFFGFHAIESRFGIWKHNWNYLIFIGQQTFPSNLEDSKMKPYSRKYTDLWYCKKSKTIATSTQTENKDFSKANSGCFSILTTAFHAWYISWNIEMFVKMVFSSVRICKRIWCMLYMFCRLLIYWHFGCTVTV